MRFNTDDIIKAIKQTIGEYETSTKGFLARFTHSGASNKIKGVKEILTSVENAAPDQNKQQIMLMALVAAINENRGSLPESLAKNLITGEYQQPEKGYADVVTQNNTLAGPMGCVLKTSVVEIQLTDIAGQPDNAQPLVIGQKIAKLSTVQHVVGGYALQLKDDEKELFGNTKARALNMLGGKPEVDQEMQSRPSQPKNNAK